MGGNMALLLFQCFGLLTLEGAARAAAAAVPSTVIHISTWLRFPSKKREVELLSFVFSLLWNGNDLTGNKREDNYFAMRFCLPK